MTRNTNNSANQESLSQAVEKLVDENGGWLNVLSYMTGTFDEALSKFGKHVDCPFPNRHSSKGGRKKFRFVDSESYANRAVCTCFQGRGLSAVELLIEDGFGHDWTSCMLAVLKALRPVVGVEHVRKVVEPKTFTPAVMDKEEVARRRKSLDFIARNLVPLDHPSAEPARKYFEKRGIPLSSNIQDVRFHPGLKHWEDGENSKDEKVLVGTFPAIVSAFRAKDGRVVNFHRIAITEDGDKAPVSKVKKICRPLPCFEGSTITISNSADRVLHVTEGVEKGWAVHLATGGSVKAAYSCSALPNLYVDRAQYDSVVIWSDCDPVNPHRERKSGEGQYYAWELARRLFQEGFDVTFLMPDGNPAGAKGRDWEDVIVKEGVLDLEGFYYRFHTLKSFAVNGGVFKQHNRAA